MDDVVACSCYAPEQANELRRVYEAHRQKLVHEVEPRCLNMHFWAENILVDAGGRATGLVDSTARYGVTQRSSPQCSATAESANHADHDRRSALGPTLRCIGPVRLGGHDQRHRDDYTHEEHAEHNVPIVRQEPGDVCHNHPRQRKNTSSAIDITPIPASMT